MTTLGYVRVINSQVLPRDILLDKIDRTSGQFETDLTYAQTAKQPVYVPYKNPLDPTVPGYIDLIPTDEVLLQSQLPKGVITKLAARGYITFFTHHAAATATPVISGAPHVAAQSGTHGQFAASIGSSAVFTDSTAAAFTASDLGSPLTVTLSSVPANEGTFQISVASPPNSVTVLFSTAAVDTAADTWSTPGGVSIAGTTLQSLTPDHTYVIVTNLSLVTQTITDTAILAAKGLVSATEVFVPNTLITGGPIAAGWKVQIQANSKKSNTFTVT